jgi:hypothetical protein
MRPVIVIVECGGLLSMSNPNRMISQICSYGRLVCLVTLASIAGIITAGVFAPGKNLETKIFEMLHQIPPQPCPDGSQGPT